MRQNICHSSTDVLFRQELVNQLIKFVEYCRNYLDVQEPYRISLIFW